MWSLFKQTFADFAEDNCPRMAAALAYYALFSLPPLLVIAITIAGFVANLGSFADDGQVRQMIESEASRSLGVGASEQIDKMITHASTAPRSTVGIIVGAAIFLLGASGVMAQLQSSLNEVWSVKPDPARGGIRNFVLKRVLSFAMVLGVGFLLLVSMVVSAVLAVLRDRFALLVPDRISDYLPMLGGVAANFLVATLLFAAMFKWLPDARIVWRDVWIGAGVTALLFVVGKTLLTVYFAHIDVGSTYGAAGSMALILAWVYYAGMIFLLGAEFTHSISLLRHGAVIPQPGAVAVETIVKQTDPG